MKQQQQQQQQQQNDKETDVVGARLGTVRPLLDVAGPNP
jgi:hypothetical protein